MFGVCFLLTACKSERLQSIWEIKSISTKLQSVWNFELLFWRFNFCYFNSLNFNYDSIINKSMVWSSIHEVLAKFTPEMVFIHNTNYTYKV